MTDAEQQWHDSLLDGAAPIGEEEPPAPAMTEAHRECERYAGAMERALERIRSLCFVYGRLGAANMSDHDVDEVLALIKETTMVRDDRATITR